MSIEELEISFPTDCVTDEEHLEYLYCADEKLRQSHNQQGIKCKNARKAYLDAVIDKYQDVILPKSEAERMQIYDTIDPYNTFHIYGEFKTIVGNNPAGLVKLIPLKKGSPRGKYKDTITEKEVEDVKQAERVYFQVLDEFELYKRNFFKLASKKIQAEIGAINETFGHTIINPEDPQRETILQQKETFKQSVRWVPDLSVLRKAIEAKDIPDPYEDLYTDYSETDPNSHIERASGTPYKVSFSSLERGETAYVYKDHGVDHFDEDFEILFESEVTSGGNSAVIALWGMANALNSFYGLDTASEDGLAVRGDIGSSGTPHYYLYELVAGTTYYDDCTVSLVHYYNTIERDEAVGTYGTLYLYIYSDASRETLYNTLTLTLHEKEDFRYYYPVQSWGDSGSVALTGYTQNHDLQESTAWEKELSESVEVAESRAMANEKTVAESINITENITVGLAFSKVLEETINVATTLVKAVGKGFNENISITESFNRLWEAIKVFTETVNVTEAISTIKGFLRTFTENISITETVIKAPQMILTDVVNVSIGLIARMYWHSTTAWTGALKWLRDLVGGSVFSKTSKETDGWTKTTKKTDGWS